MTRRDARHHFDEPTAQNQIMSLSTNNQTSHESQESSGQPDDRDELYRKRIVTIPNIICAVRLVGALVMIIVAVQDYPRTFVTMFTVLSLSDWIDGKLARWLHQRSDFGARLDSFADSVLYGALFVGSCILKWEVLQHEVVWIGFALGSYVLTSGFGLWKFGKIPSYHTYGAKTTQWVILGGAICLLTDISLWPFRIAMIGVTLTNIETTAMTWLLDEWRADILSVLHVLRQKNSASDSNATAE